MRPFLLFGTLAAVAATAITARGVQQLFWSSENRVSLIELYTSEGCSSCPPAERWFVTLKDQPGLWRDFVPVEFHVNSWDRLGWRDRFSSRDATQRQNLHAAAWNSGSVYTPCFVRDGAEWRTEEKTLEPSREKTGMLSLSVLNGKTCRAEFKPATAAGEGGNEFDVYVALLGSGFTSEVTGGENRGQTLRHEFVVLAFAKNPLSAPTGDKGGHTAEFEVPASKITDAARLAIAAWVTRRGQMAPLQATGGWLESAEK